MGQLDQGRELAAALDNDEFALHFQPIVRLMDLKIVGFEALVRWLHPERGILLPDAFIPLAEASGLMPRLGQWIVHTAAHAMRQIDVVLPAPAAGQPAPYMTVNLSPKQLDDPGLASTIERALAENRLKPGRLRFELSEPALAGRVDDVARFALSCAELGVTLSIDQFGTGQNALAALYKLPVAGIKLAACFVHDLGRYPRSAPTLGALALFAQKLRLECVASCVENYRQAAMARDLGLEFGQGHFFGGAMPLMVATGFVRRAMERTLVQPASPPMVA